MFQTWLIWASEMVAKVASGSNPMSQVLSQIASDVAKGNGWLINPVTLFTVMTSLVAFVVVAVKRKLRGQ